MTGVIGGGIVCCGLIAGLAAAGVPMAVVAAVAFGLAGVLGAWTRLQGRWQPRSQGMRFQPLTGRLRAAAARPRWTTGELAALDDEDSLEQILGETAAPPEGKFR